MLERLALGRLFIWLIQINGLFKPLWQRHELLQELHECDVCLGFWVYLVIFLLPRQTRVMSDWPKFAESVALAGAATFAVHLIRIGWQAKFETVILD